MKRATLIVAGLLLGLMLCSAVLAYTISGYVYFDTAKTKRARCCEVAIWMDDNCDADSLTMTVVDEAGYYEFTGLGSGEYSVRAKWGNTPCASCDPGGSECEQVAYSQCGYVEVDSTDASQDLIFDIDCRCTEDDPK